jgi:carbamoyl-phosphate synthase small subunit
LDAVLLLSDGSEWRGKGLGASASTAGEVVFNTGMTGYQEILSDPSYAGQIVLFTYPLIGNYGVNLDDFESDRVQPSAVIVREACREPSNWRSRITLDGFLKERGIPGIEGIDTRALAIRIRENGVTMGAIAADRATAEAALGAAADYGSVNFVDRVTASEPYAWGFSGREEVDADAGDFRAEIAVLDCGLKFNILRRFAALGVRSVVYPASASPEQIMSRRPAGVLLSPGPGDPALLASAIETTRALVGQRPIFGICLGNQLLCHAAGGETFKLKFGHRGSNHPVQDLRDGSVTITSQNHGYAVNPESLDEARVEVTQINLNDGTVEGIALRGADAESIQYHPEAAPGPWDSRPQFRRFFERITQA